MTGLLPVALAAVAAAVGVLGEDAGDRLGQVLPVPAPTPIAAAGPFGQLDPRALRGACLLAGAAAVLVAPGAVGLLLAAALALLGPGAVRRLQPPIWQVEDSEAARDLPLALDLLASCLSGGAPLDRSVAAVAVAVPGACGRRLTKVARALAVGTPPAEAWQLLAGPQSGSRDGSVVAGDAGAFGDDLAGGLAADLRRGLGGKPGGRAAGRPGRGPAGGSGPGAGRDPDSRSGGPAGAAARALARAAEGGAPVANTVARIAASVRAEAGAEASRAARRAGVMAVGPLGLCFLPAFVVLGVVPAIVGLAEPLLSGL